MQTLQTFQLCFKTEANPFFLNFFYSPHFCYLWSEFPRIQERGGLSNAAILSEWQGATKHGSSSLIFLITYRHRVTHPIPTRAWELLAWRAGISTSEKPHPDSNPPRVASYTSSPLFPWCQGRAPQYKL